MSTDFCISPVIPKKITGGKVKMKMNYLQYKKNAEIGRKLADKREENGLKQPELASKINNHYIEDYEKVLLKNNFSPQEINSFFNVPYDELDESLIRRLKIININQSFVSIAVSTISHYENGATAIPAWYVDLIEEFFGKL